MRSESLNDSHEWLRIADRLWRNPLDPSFAQAAGGRWNPPASFPVLYCNEDVVTARLNLKGFIARWPYEPEDLRNDNGPILVGVLLPSRQRVADIHTPVGVKAVGLPSTYPRDRAGSVVPHSLCQVVGSKVKRAGLRGIRCRSAGTANGAGRELAWFPATIRSVARLSRKLAYDDWYWS